MEKSELFADCLAIIEFLKAYALEEYDKRIAEVVRLDLVGKAALLAPEEIALLAHGYSDHLSPAAPGSPDHSIMKELAHRSAGLAKNAPTPKGCLLFIHGIGSSCESTWNTMSSLVKSHPEISSYWDIEYFDYSTKKLRWRPWILGGKKNIPIADLAKSLKGHIDRKCSHYESVIVIAHSMGGLISAKYILNEKEEHHHQVKGFMFFATPWQGSQLASLASSLSFKNWHAKFMIRFSPEVRETTEQFKKKAKNIPHRLLFGGQDIAVTHEGMSTIFSMDNFTLLHEATHSTITNATDYNSDSFVELKLFTDSFRTT